MGSGPGAAVTFRGRPPSSSTPSRERVVATHELFEGALERAEVEVPLDACAAVQMVRGVAGHEPVEEPETVLLARQALLVPAAAAPGVGRPLVLLAAGGQLRLGTLRGSGASSPGAGASRPSSASSRPTRSRGARACSTLMTGRWTPVSAGARRGAPPRATSRSPAPPGSLRIDVSRLHPQLTWRRARRRALRARRGGPRAPPPRGARGGPWAPRGGRSASRAASAATPRRGSCGASPFVVTSRGPGRAARKCASRRRAGRAPAR